MRQFIVFFLFLFVFVYGIQAEYIPCNIPATIQVPQENVYHEFTCPKGCRPNNATISIGYMEGIVSGWSPWPPTIGTGVDKQGFICSVCGTHIGFTRYIIKVSNTGEFQYFDTDQGKLKWYKIEWWVSSTAPVEWKQWIVAGAPPMKEWSVKKIGKIASTWGLLKSGVGR